VARRASRHITLVLIGSAALAGCGREAPVAETARDNYTNLADCAADWGRPEYCERQELATNAGNSVIFRGPAYFAADRLGAQRQALEDARRAGAAGGPMPGSNRSIGRTTTLGSSALGRSPAASASRGGFGRTGRSFGSVIG
jgi:uncharacterized protein YgiB involved in biofilm formation